MITAKEKLPNNNGCEVIRSHILTTYKNGDKLPKTGELSRKLGTTRYAAERVLTELSAEGVVERIPRFGSIFIGRKKKVFHPAKHDTKSIAFMADELESYISSEMLRGIDAKCREKEINISLLNSDYDISTEEQHLRNLLNNGFSGAVLRIGEHMENLRVIEEVISDDFPIVLIDRNDCDNKFVTVKTDNYNAAYKAVKHLTDLGHERIAYISYSGQIRPLLKEMQDRKNGYIQALKDASIEINDQYIVGSRLFRQGERPTQSYLENIGYEPMNRLLLSGKRPTAVFFMYFYFALGALRAIRDHGLRVPQDISLVCIDDETMAPYLNPPMTVVAQPLREMGTLAVEILDDIIKGKKPSKREYLLDGQLIVRGSTSQPK